MKKYLLFFSLFLAHMVCAQLPPEVMQPVATKQNKKLLERAVLLAKGTTYGFVSLAGLLGWYSFAKTNYRELYAQYNVALAFQRLGVKFRNPIESYQPTLSSILLELVKTIGCGIAIGLGEYKLFLPKTHYYLKQAFS